MMKYKNYLGHVVFDDDADIFHGEVINTRDVIMAVSDGRSLNAWVVETIKKAVEE